MILVWRNGVSRRLETSYKTQAALSERNETLSRFLRAVSDGQPTAIAALEKDMTVRFANKQMGQIVGIPAQELEDRRLDTAFDNKTATLLKAKTILAAQGENQSIPSLQSDVSSDRQYQTQLLQLSADATSSAEVLLVMQDITDLTAAKKRSESLFRRLIGTLTQIIDARDPWSKHHSARVADVAVAIGAELGWKNDNLETLEIAGQMVNLGKIFVPIDILTKQTPLTKEELDLVRGSMRKGTQLLSGIDLIGPVSATLEQMSERWDGSGTPGGLKGEAIEPGARILSVANAFVGIVSARAHRESLGFDKAIDILHQEAGKAYERRVVAALQNILENKQGRDLWADYIHMPVDT
jgi:HD-GYP domain-containing protein (c-di-GMP phosphodiesterase class II)